MSTDRSLNGTLPLPSFFQIYTNLTHLTDNIFLTDRLKQQDDNHTYYFKRAILALVNDTVNSLNMHMLGLFDGEEEVLHSVDSANVNREHHGEHKVPVEMLQLLQPHSVPPTKLKVKL
jgi:hypothetical protein